MAGNRHKPPHRNGTHRQAGPAPAEVNGLIALYQAKQWARLEAEARGMAARYPTHSYGWTSLGLALQELGRLPEAVAALVRAVRFAPQDAGTHGNLGSALKALGRHAEAEASYRRALALQPDHAGLHYNLGNLLQAIGRLAEAEASFRRALEIQPGYVAAQANLGNVLQNLGRLADAETAFRRALEIDPDSAKAHNNLGNVLKDLWRFSEAEACYRRALALQPGNAEALCNLGNTCREARRLSDAESCYRHAIGINPELAEAHCGLGNVLLDAERFAEAENAYRRALELDPDSAKAHNNLAKTFKDTCRYTEAVACLRRALAIDPDYLDARSNLLFSMLYDSAPAQQYTREAVEYGCAASAKVAARHAAWSCPEHPERLRVGIVSGDLCHHPVGYFLESVLSSLDKTRVELYAYPARLKDDDLAARLRQHFVRWQQLAGLGDEAAAKLIHGDGIHILLDLSGHTAYNRLPLFAWKPAPVQATWLGYSASTGLAEMDYLIADPHVAPPEDEWQFTEKIWRMPDTYLCLTASEEAVEIGSPPALAAGIVTFGSFNNLSKVNDATVALWSKILHAVPKSRLLLKAKQLRDPAVREAVARRFAACGIGEERLLLEGMIPKRADHLASYNRMDIALDPFPYAGTTTSVEALWMGVPFLTRRGDRFVAHVGESIARNAGLPGWIAADEDEYVAKAVAFASDLDALAELRAGLRRRVLASPLFDAPRFARHLEDALWGMWEQAGRCGASQLAVTLPDPPSLERCRQ